MRGGGVAMRRSFIGLEHEHIIQLKSLCKRDNYHGIISMIKNVL